ncbi:uncharacterized protein [Antedon mediterranea]|uniref:uncharacterized protein n=1 Tax=Antedon mediterranea TaxID=105859 RepID=UPI003AF559CC
MAEKQARVFLWCIPRSVSTAFEICMGKLDDVQVINEPYVAALLVGPDFQQDLSDDLREMRESMNKIASVVEVNCDNPWKSDDLTLQFVKDRLEDEYPSKRVIFVKDMASTITADTLHMLPKGYKHAFLIRSPEKVFPSQKKLFNKFTTDEVMLKVGKHEVVPEHYAFGETLHVYEHLTKTGIEPKPFIMDADDLLENPESILRQFCAFAGIEFTNKLLSWDGGHDVTKYWIASKEMLQWNSVGNFHKNAFESKGFIKPSAAPSKSELSEDVLHCIEASFPYYNKLFELRAKIR